MPTILLSHAEESRANYYGPRALAALQSLAEVRLNETGAPLPTEALIEAACGCEIILSDRMTPGEAQLFDNAPDLVVFLRCAVDVRTVDIPAASRNGVLVANAAPGFIDSVSELVFGLMIDLARGITGYATAYRQERPQTVAMGGQLAGGTLGILGYGNIGARVAALGQAFGMTVLVNDPYKTIEAPGIVQVEMDDLLTRSDHIVCLVVANDATENLLDAAAFARMKPSAFFINVSRGNLVDEAALEAALVSGGIAGAAMDVGRAPDQMPSPGLAKLPNVIATPHIGGLTPQAIEAQALGTVAQVEALLSGRLPERALNAPQAHRLTRLGIAPPVAETAS